MLGPEDGRLAYEGLGSAHEDARGHGDPVLSDDARGKWWQLLPNCAISPGSLMEELLHGTAPAAVRQQQAGPAGKTR